MECPCPISIIRLLYFLMKPVDHSGFFLPVAIAWSVKVCYLYIKECSLHRRPETSGTNIRSGPWAFDGGLQFEDLSRDGDQRWLYSNIPTHLLQFLGKEVPEVVMSAYGEPYVSAVESMIGIK